jgi:hypothetical protein
MPLIAKDRPNKTIPLWEKTLKEQIKTGQAVPIISGQVIHDLIFGGQANLVKAYADHIRSTLTDKNNGEQLRSTGARDGLASLCANYIQYLLSEAEPDQADLPQLGGDDLLLLTKFKQITDDQIKSAAHLQRHYLDFIKSQFYYLASITFDC